MNLRSDISTLYRIIMAKKRRMRKMAKNIAKQKKLKKMMAEFIAKREFKDIIRDREKLMDMLVKGHRGLLAMNEKELADKFDKLYDQLDSNKNLMLDVEFDDRGYYWEENMKTLNQTIAEAEKIYGEVFEDVFL